MKKTPEECLEALRLICEELGWCIGMLENEDNYVSGLVIGLEPFVDEILANNGEAYSVSCPPSSESSNIH